MGNDFSQAGQPIYNPGVPYRGSLPMAPGHGATVFVCGIIPHHCNRFEINLETNMGDKALHFNPRFEGMNAVIRNTCQQGNWGSEEKHGYFPFAHGQPFEVQITIEQPHYRISVNGSHFCDYRHRVPKESARQLTIEGDIQVTQIRFQNGAFDGGSHHHRHHGEHKPAHHPPPTGSYPPPTGGYPPPVSYPGTAPPVYNPPVPYNGHIPGGLSPGRMIRINGQSTYNPSRFNVNLVAGNDYFGNGDIGMHCDVRFNYGDSRNVVVRTNRQNGAWGNEERHASYFPFVPNVPFEILIRVEHDKYMIAVNNQHLFEFRHRLHPIQRFDHLTVEGDVQLNMIQFQ